MSEARKILTFPFKLLGKGTMCLFKKQVIRSTEGVSWASTQQYHQYLNAGNQGLLLNGEEAQLTPSVLRITCFLKRHIVPFPKSLKGKVRIFLASDIEIKKVRGYFLLWR